MQHLGVCQSCDDAHRQWVYLIIHPTTGDRLWVCGPCERAFAQLREPPDPAYYYEHRASATTLIAQR